MGKTHLAKQLHSTLGWEYIARDGIKQRLLRDGCPEDALGKKSYDVLWSTLEERLAAGRSVISDTNLNQPIALEHIEHIVHRTGAKVVVLSCFCDADTHKKRLESRKAQGLAGFWIDSWEKYQTYAKSAENQGDFDIPHPTLQVDTGRPIDTDKLARQIQAVRGSY